MDVFIIIRKSVVYLSVEPVLPIRGVLDNLRASIGKGHSVFTLSNISVGDGVVAVVVAVFAYLFPIYIYELLHSGCIDEK